MSSLEKCLSRFSVHSLVFLFFLLVLRCMNCLCILELNPFSVVSDTINLSHLEGYLFSLFIVSFAVQNLLILIRSHLFIFVLISISLGGES